MIAFQEEKKYMWCMIGAAICDVILNFLFIPNFGAFGAAIATMLTEICIFILYTFLMRKFLKQIIIKKHIIQCFVATAFMGFILFIEQKFLKLENLELVIIPISGAIVYVLTLLVFKNEFVVIIKNQFFEKVKISKN